MEKVISHSDFLSRTAKAEKSLLLLYKAGSELSDCAFKNLKNAVNISSGTIIYYADVTSVSDIHQVYGITSVPALLVFTKGKLKNIIKGCQGSSYYKALAESTLFKHFRLIISRCG